MSRNILPSNSKVGKKEEEEREDPATEMSKTKILCMHPHKTNFTKQLEFTITVAWQANFIRQNIFKRAVKNKINAMLMKCKNDLVCERRVFEKLPH